MYNWTDREPEYFCEIQDRIESKTSILYFAKPQLKLTFNTSNFALYSIAGIKISLEVEAQLWGTDKPEFAELLNSEDFRKMSKIVTLESTYFSEPQIKECFKDDVILYYMSKSLAERTFSPSDLRNFCIAIFRCLIFHISWIDKIPQTLEMFVDNELSRLSFSNRVDWINKIKDNLPNFKQIIEEHQTNRFNLIYLIKQRLQNFLSKKDETLLFSFLKRNSKGYCDWEKRTKFLLKKKKELVNLRVDPKKSTSDYHKLHKCHFCGNSISEIIDAHLPLQEGIVYCNECDFKILVKSLLRIAKGETGEIYRKEILYNYLNNEMIYQQILLKNPNDKNWLRWINTVKEINKERKEQ